MRIERVILRFVRATLTRPFENRWQRYRTWTKLVIEVDGGEHTGLGECAAMETPFYSYETIETAWHITERYLAPMLLREQTTDPGAAQRLWSDVNGHDEAKAGVECALWDLRARVGGVPLSTALGGKPRPVPAAATAGIEPTIDALLSNVGHMRDTGFQRVRIKIRPGWDLEPVREVRAAFPDLPLIADANAAYGADAVADLALLDEHGLTAIEQPFPRHLLAASATLQERIATPICLDEQVHSVREMRQALRAGAGRMLNLKTGRVGGPSEVLRIHDFCRAEGVDMFVGGKWDQGLGRWNTVAMATLPGITMPSDVGPSAHYYVDDGAEPKLSFSAPGWVAPTDAPGLGAVLGEGAEVIRKREITAKELQA